MTILMSRCFHTSRYIWAAAASTKPSVEKSALAKLRKATGYSFSKCKEALEKHGNDVKEAETWLKQQAQAHGWEKATKLQGRATAQGLVSILSSQHNAVMLEVNCETDFVARNKKFQSLVHRITSGCYGYSKGQSEGNDTILSKITMTSDEIGKLPLDGTRTLKDEAAVSIGEVGENIQLRRAVSLQSGKAVLLAGYTHPAAEGSVLGKDIVQFGKFGAVVAYRSTEKKDKGRMGSGSMAEIGRQLCQHIVGMNPKEIGSMDAPPAPTTKTSEPEPPPVTQEQPAESQGEDESEFVAKASKDEDETILVNQEFLLDPDLTVREFLVQNSIEVVDFVRFECGEELIETSPSANTS